MHARSLPKRQRDQDVDQRIVLRDLSWTHYETLLAMRGDRPGLRIAYLEGDVELMTPSQSHEIISTEIGRLLEVYALEEDIPLTGVGSWTVKRAEVERGVEPDECYSLGPPHERPDLAIEVEWSRSALDKLEIYRGLGVPEVWIWRDGTIEVHVLDRGVYAKTDKSLLLPNLDLKELASYVGTSDQHAAVRALRDALRSRAETKQRPPAKTRRKKR
jgi:Uma2 family endonuclease